MSGFAYSAEVLDKFPNTRAGVIHAKGLENGPTPSSLIETFDTEQAKVRAEIGDTSLSDLPTLAAWRRVFTGFGVKPTQYRSAAESLLRRLTKQGDIPTINTLVDMANLVSIRHRVPVAVFDQRHVRGRTTVRFATGEERFTDLGGIGITHPEPAEVVFVDDSGLVSARRWCWRQSAESAASPSTRETLITVEGQHEHAEITVEAAVTDLSALLAEFQPQASISSAILGSERAEFPYG